MPFELILEWVVLAIIVCLYCFGCGYNACKKDMEDKNVEK